MGEGSAWKHCYGGDRGREKDGNDYMQRHIQTDREHTLDNWRREIEDLDVGLVELLTQTHGKGVESGFRGTVCRERREGDDRNVRGGVDDRCGALLCEEERQERMG